jgi:hypothetical protein
MKCQCLHCPHIEKAKPKDSAPKRKSRAKAVVTLFLALIGPIVSLFEHNQT